MAPSFLKSVGAAALAFAANTGATQSYQVSEVYNSTNFFDKFNFFTSTDPNGGYVQFQSQSAAQDLGLVKYQNGAAYVGVDTSSGYSASGVGRKSVRLESKNVYNHGLVIAEFSHLPKPVCGSWPAFWFFGAPWPTKGEVDLYENWNDLTFNRHTAHVDSPDVVGECTLAAADMSATIDSANCYDFAQGQYDYQGCSASEYSSNFGSSSGGIYAMEWTSDYIKIWDWSRTGAPSDILNGKPVPGSSWGTPSYAIKQCNIDKAFKDMNMVLNIDFCGVAGQSDKWDSSCKASTGSSTCAEYVAKGNSDFADVYFQVEDIKVYQLQDTQTSTSSAVSSTSSKASTSSSSSLISSATTSSSWKRKRKQRYRSSRNSDSICLPRRQWQGELQRDPHDVFRELHQRDVDW
ncbi:putative endo-1,3(4)-beta-glucanase [Annulohypoxylon stygium]|nr:putative endo-1,3(4)-beta-glucanase [Annulohypoxylon stygium]